jgi:hypothetical protein
LVVKQVRILPGQCGARRAGSFWKAFSSTPLCVGDFRSRWARPRFTALAWISAPWSRDRLSRRPIALRVGFAKPIDHQGLEQSDEDSCDILAAAC